ncbi:MAG: SLC13 family permease [Bacillota bacterium]
MDILTFEIGLTLGILLITIALFITEAFRVDIIAILVMLTLGWTGLLEPQEVFSGLSSNAVIAIIAIMIIGEGIEKSGAMEQLAQPLIALAGQEQKRLTAVLSITAGFISGAMQNIGVIALFLPVVRKSSRKLNFPLRKMLMPVGFAVLLGGNLTMVGAGNLIILNDLLLQQGAEAFNLFAPLPIGLILLLFGVGYFYLFGDILLPSSQEEQEEGFSEKQERIIESRGLETKVYEVQIPKDCTITGMTQSGAGIWEEYNLYLLALQEEDDLTYAPWRFTRLAAQQKLVLMGEEGCVKRFVDDYELELLTEYEDYQAHPGLADSAFAELMIPPRSDYQGKTLRDISLRKNYQLNPIKLVRGEKEISGDFSDMKFHAGDTLVVYGPISNIKHIKNQAGILLLTSLKESSIDNKPVLAMAAFLFSIGLILFGINIALAFFSGAVIIMLSGIINKEQIYQAVDWKTVFLLTGLIPLGIAMEKTGAAEFLARLLIGPLAEGPVFVILLAIALLASSFTLFMSNVASVVVLVPLVMVIGRELGIDPSGLALLVGLSASNSFILPTHQVNAFFMNAGQYKSRDFFRAGGLLTLSYILLSAILVYFFYI